MALMWKDVLEDDYVQIPNKTAKAVEIRNNEKTISLEALGLIVNLWSYDVKKWEVRKTELYKRFGQNKKTSVGHAWDELVENRFIIEFKYRNGRKWQYVYIYRIRPYSEEEVKIKLAQAVELAGVSSTSDFQHLKTGSTKRTPQNPHLQNKECKQDKIKKEKPKKDFTSLAEIDSNPNVINDDDEKEPFEINFYAFMEFKKDFEDNFPNTFDEAFYGRIIQIMTEKQMDFITYPEAVEQLKYMADQRAKGLIIADSAKFFIGGIELRRTSRVAAMEKATLRRKEKELKAQKEKQEQEQEQSKPVPFYNWLEQ